MHGKGAGRSVTMPGMVHSPWLRHLRQDVRQPWDVTMEAHQEILEVQMLGLARDIQAQHGVTPSVGRQTATNLIVAEALELQRQHSPGGQAAMVGALLSADPALAGFREALGLAGVRAAQRAYWRGMGMGMIVACFVMALARMLAE